MPSFSYTSAIPAGSDIPSQSQSNLQTNCTSINNILNVDLIGFNSANGGLHQKVTFATNNPPSAPPPAAVTVTPPVLFTNTQDGAGNNLPASLAQLFLYTGTPSQGQSNYISLSTGSVLLFGGIILKWGQTSGASSGSQTVNFAPSPGNFPNACFDVFLTGRNAGTNTSGFNVNAVSSTSFTFYGSSHQNVYWFAIGN